MNIIALSLLLLLIGWMPAWSAVVVSNFASDDDLAGTTTSSTTSVGLSTTVGTTRNFRALQFVHGGGVIEQIQLGLSNFTLGGSPVTDINSVDVNPRVRIFSDSGNLPLNALATLVLNRSGVTLEANHPTTLTFDLTTSLTLQAGDSFWVVVSRGNEASSPSNTGNFRWNFASGNVAPSEIDDSGFSYGGRALVGNVNYSGSGPFPSIPTVWNEYTGAVPAIAILVPEPTAALLGAMGMLALLRRRR